MNADGQRSLWINGQTLWLLGMVFNITASLLGSVNFIATIIQLRAPGMTWMRLPFFVWAQFVTAFLLLLAFPPLEAAGLMQLTDRVFGTCFFMPTGLVLNQHVAQTWSGGGSPVLWQHLFWFLAHPEVYVLILPGIGMVAEILANNTRKPLYGYKAMVAAILVLAFLSFIVWAHHMYMTGMGAKVSAFFQTTTIHHLRPLGHSAHGAPHFALGRLDPIYRADALCLGVPADVRHRRPHRHPARLQCDRPLPARYLLRHRAFPLRRRAGHHLRHLRRRLLLVPEGDRPA